jgi:hypothetical protein
MDILQNIKAHLNLANGNVQAARNEYERRKKKKKKGILGIKIPIIDDISVPFQREEIISV